MAKGDFVWCDLSTLRLANTKTFYSQVFGWTYDRGAQPDGSAYETARTAAGEAAGLFEMPETFQKPGLPSFWMPYIAVDDVEATCEQAHGAGGKVELGPLAWSEHDRIALIRDPLGAGFTVHEGVATNARAKGEQPDHMVWRALYVSDVAAVRDFYEALFDWRIVADPASPGRYDVRNARGDAVAEMHALDEELRGPYEFWGIHFAVSDRRQALRDIERNGGEVVYRDPEDSSSPTLVKDPDGAACFIREAPEAARAAVNHASSKSAAWRWKTVLALLVIYAAVLLEQNWVWGVLFILWTIPALRSGETFLVEPVSRRANPVVFWLLIATWIGLSLFLVIADLGSFGTSWTAG